MEWLVVLLVFGGLFVGYLVLDAADAFLPRALTNLYRRATGRPSVSQDEALLMTGWIAFTKLDRDAAFAAAISRIRPRQADLTRGRVELERTSEHELTITIGSTKNPGQLIAVSVLDEEYEGRTQCGFEPLGHRQIDDMPLGMHEYRELLEAFEQGMKQADPDVEFAAIDLS